MDQIRLGEVVKVTIEARTPLGEKFEVRMDEFINPRLEVEHDYTFSPYAVLAKTKFCFTGKAESFVLEMNPEEKHPEIENVIYHDPAVIVFWKDGTKTIVKTNDESYDPEKGLAMAISKKVYGNKGNYYEEFKKWLPKTVEKDTPDVDSGSGI